MRLAPAGACWPSPSGLASWLVGGVTTWWAAQVLGQVGLAPLPLAIRVAALLAVGSGVGQLYAKGHVGPLLLAAAVAVVGWVGVAVQVPWLYHLTAHVRIAMVPTGDQIIPQSAAFMTQLYWSRLADLASLGAASVIVVIPFFAGPTPKSTTTSGRRGRGGWGAPPAIAATFGVASLGLMALGTELVGVGFGNPAQAALLAGGRAATLAVVAGAVGLLASMSGIGAGMWRRPPMRIATVAGALLLAGWAAVALFPPLSGLLLQRHPLPAPNQLVNAQAGVLAASYLVAPWLGVFLARQLWRRRAPGPVALTGVRPAGPIAAWLLGLAASVPFMQGFARWAGGPWLHRWAPGIPPHWFLWFWVALQPGRPDVALPVGVLSAGLVYAGGHAAHGRWRAPR